MERKNARRPDVGGRSTVYGRRGAVACEHPDTALAGIRTLDAGPGFPLARARTLLPYIRAPPVTEVLEYRPYEDGYLQLELRCYLRRDGSARERGPY